MQNRDSNTQVLCRYRRRVRESFGKFGNLRGKSGLGSRCGAGYGSTLLCCLFNYTREASQKILAGQQLRGVSNW